MKILLIEDTREKAKAIAQLLIEVNPNIDITPCENSSDAKKLLKSNEYDIALVDLFIPKSLFKDPSPDEGFALLTEILDSGNFIKPKKILCLTEHDNVFNDYKDLITDELITVHQFSHQNDKWKEILKKEVERCEHNNKVAPKSFKSDFLVICALKDPELKALLNLDYEWSDPKLFESNSVYYSGEIRTSSSSFTINAAYQDRMGSVNTAILTTKLIEHFCPRYVVMLGICAGDKECTNLGDVIFASPSINCDYGKWVKDGGKLEFKHDPHHLPASTKFKGLIDLLSNQESDIYQVYSSFNGDKPANLPSIKIGPLACGSSVIADSIVYNNIKAKQGRKMLGLDMESYGFYAACEAIHEPKPEYCCIKSISDFADSEKKDQYQKYASFISSKIFDLLLKKYHDHFESSP